MNMKSLRGVGSWTAKWLLLQIIIKCAASLAAIKPDIRVDTNRDGVVDISPTSDDIQGKSTWTEDRGAIFIASIGYTLSPGDCPALRFKSVFCHNGAQDIALAPEYLAPIRTVPITGNLPEGIYGRIKVLGNAVPYTSVFYQVEPSGEWVANNDSTDFNAGQLMRGLTLGIQGRDVVRDDRLWNGTAIVQFSIIDPSSNVTTVDEVMLKIAPVLTHHHLQKAVKVLTLGGNNTIPDQVLFANDIAKEVKAAGIREPVHLFNHSSDPWAQDFFESGYTSFPGPGGKPILLRVLIRSAQPTRASGGQLLGELASRDVGILETSDGSRSEINSMGNLETIPPYSYKGRSFPAGRILIGNWGDQRMAWGVVGMLQAQRIQDPLFMDTDWLRAGHVDEVFQFLPDNNQSSVPKVGYRNWKVVVASPAYALQLLQKAENEGYGNTKLVSRGNSFGAHIPDFTISSFLSNPAHLETNERAWERIQRNIDMLIEETGIRKEDLTPVPVLYENDNSFGYGSFYANYNSTKFYGGDYLSPLPAPVAPGRLKVGPILPCAVNGLLLSDTKVIVPRQWGPVIQGKDIFEEAVHSEYTKLGIQVAWVDDWTTHHEGGGDVHCGTNTLREGGKWWY